MGNRHALRISARGRAIHQNTAYCSILRRGHLALLSAFHTSCPTFLKHKCLHSSVRWYGIETALFKERNPLS